jgi:hypothetical protein
LVIGAAPLCHLWVSLSLIIGRSAEPDNTSSFSEEIIVRIASYGSAIDMARIALISRSLGHLVENTARDCLLARIARDELYTYPHPSTCEYHDLVDKRIPAKLAATPNEEDFSWIRLYHELEIIYACRPRTLKLVDYVGDNESIERDINSVTDEDGYLHEGTKLDICGPEYDSHSWGFDEEDEDEDEEQQLARHSVPAEGVERIYRAILTMPHLKQIMIDYSWYTEGEGEIEASHLCWLLSPQSNYRTLRVLDLSVSNQVDVENLAAAFASCSSIETLCIMPIHIGYLDVQNVAPLMQAISELPNLKRLRLGIEAYGNRQALNRYINQSLPILNSSVRGFVYIPSSDNSQLKLRYHELRNCSDMGVQI